MKRQDLNLSPLNAMRKQVKMPTVLWNWLESLLVTGAILWLTHTFHPQDPFTFQSHFPWIWLVPIAFALRYGIGQGFLSALMVGAGFLQGESQWQFEDEPHRLFLLGGLLLTLLCGEFSSVWRRRFTVAENKVNYLEARLSNLTKAYYMTRLSHDTLEQNLINAPITLRSAITDIRHLIQRSGGRLSRDSADRLLHLLCHYCSIEYAALYPLIDGEWDINPVACLGPKTRLTLENPLVQRVLETKQVCFVGDVDGLTHHEKIYLVVAPLMDSQQNMIGLLTVEDMPFLALHHETLEVLSILMSYFGQDVNLNEVILSLKQQNPHCPTEFLSEFFKLKALYEKLGVESMLVTLSFDDIENRKDLMDALSHQHRGLDMPWVDEASRQIFIIMPFGTEYTVKGYLNRISDWLKQHHQLTLNEGGIHSHCVSLGKVQDFQQLMDASGDMRRAG